MENKEQPATQPVEPTKGRSSPPSQLFTLLFVVGVLAVGVLAVGVYAFPSFLVKEVKPPQYVHLKTGGTSVMAVMMQNRWKAQYLKKKNIQLDYDSTGTTVGVDKMIERQLSIAFTHAPISSEKQKKVQSMGGELVQVPIMICGVVPIYHIPEFKGKRPVNFTGEVLANIFLGNIKTWDHPDLKAINKDLTLPPTPITVVHREDSSGTTLIFTDYLSKASAKWREKFPRGDSKIEWPVGVGAERNMNLSIQVSQTPGAIGYVDLLYTHLNKDLEFEYGAIQNHDKSTFLRADADNMTAAAREGISGMQGDLVLDIADKPGPKSYPISGVIYAICYRNQSAETREMVSDFLLWATHEGQEFSEKMSYAPLPPELITHVDKQLKLLEPSH